ncbi:lipase family protein [Wolbachia endosymbiont (group A) of Pogonocherus hispidulus]|uniref:lipase family protein n=1 Tax=Wolbachia endosymbiont (group A) of Pogonocherus hispidulus TaxID=3066136 RepID=UPI0033420232
MVIRADSLDSSWVDVSGEIIGTEDRHHSRDSGIEDQPDQDSTTTLEFKLTQSLLDQVKADKNDPSVNSGKQAYKDLPRMSFVINGQAIDKEFVSQQCNTHSEGVKDDNYRQTAKQVFTEMFKHAKAEVPNDHILEELITSCNQAGYEFAMYGQIQPILAQYNLTPTIPEKTMGIHCNSANSVSVEYSEVIVVKNPDSEQLEEYKCDSKLRFTLKSQDGKVEYENGKVTFTVPQELNNYKTDGKSLLGDIKECFEDVDNRTIEDLTDNIGDERQFNEEPNGDDSNLEQDEFEITDIQEEQGPSVLGSNRTEIAGFSQEKLLEIINFVKVGYYVGDYNLNNKKFSELEERSYRVPAKLKEEGYKIIQFYNMRDNEQPYRHAGYVFIKDKGITIVYRGSRNWFDYMKDAEMILTSSGELLPEGGKIHSGFYSLFKDSWESVYKILKGYANDQQLEIKDFKINLTGHSMGGAIATIAALCLSVREGAEDFHVATFASPRVFDSAAAEVYEERLGKKTIRVVNQSDFIPSLPLGSMGYKHVGEQLRISSSSSLYAHPLDVYRNLIANLKPDQFKSDNSVSIYYYLSYLVTVLYNVSTVPSYLIPNTHSNGDEQYFKQVKNKHKDASLSEMMKYSGSSNEQKVVIYEDSEPGEDGFIIFHTLDNLLAMMLSLPRHGRGEGLKVNVPDIAFFVNNNYYLSGNTISLRLLKTLVDNYPGSLALMKKKSNKLNGGSSSTAAISTLTIAEVSSTNSSLGDHSNNNVQIAVQSDENQQMNSEKAGSSNTPGIPEQILVPSNEKELVASTGYGMGDVITKTGNAGDLRVATLGAQQVVPRGGTVSTIEALKNLPNNRTIKIFLLNGQSVAQIFKKSDREVEFSFSNGNTYELNLHLINEESLKVLFNKENSVLANAINDFSTVKMPILEQKSGKNEQAPIQLAGHVIREDSIQVVQPKSLVNIRDNNVQLVNESDQPIQNDNVVASISSDDNHSDSSKIQLDESRTGSDQVSNQSTGHITKMDNEQAPLSEGNSKLESDQQDPQPEVLPIVLNGNPNNIAVTNENVKMPILEQKSDTKTNNKQSTNPNNVGVTAPSVQPAPPKSVDKNSGKEDTQSKSTGVHLVASKNPKRVNNAQGNSKQPSYNPAPQNAKSKLPVIAASMLAITGVATGIAIAVYLEMLMVGIAVGACCLVAAAIIYYCNKPLNSLEGSSVDKFTDGAYYTAVN